MLDRVFLQSALGLHAPDPSSARARLPLLYEALAKLRRSRSSLGAGEVGCGGGGGGGGRGGGGGGGNGDGASGFKHLRGASLRTTSSTALSATSDWGTSTSSASSSRQLAAAGFAESQRLDDLDNPKPFSFKNI
jgi:hypothetical protein